MCELMHGMAAERHGHGMLCVNPPLGVQKWLLYLKPSYHVECSSKQLNDNICVCVCVFFFLTDNYWFLYFLSCYSITLVRPVVTYGQNRGHSPWNRKERQQYLKGKFCGKYMDQ